MIKKPGKLRVGIDLQELAKVCTLTVLDAKDGFHQVKLDHWKVLHSQNSGPHMEDTTT